jgi:hypothetical protein
MNLFYAIKELTENSDNSIFFQQNLLNLFNNPKIWEKYPELKKHKNFITAEVDKELKEIENKIRKIELYSFFYKMAKEILAEKSEKIIKLKNYVEKSKQESDLFQKVQKFFHNIENKNPDEIIDKMSNQMINAYGMLKNITNNSNLNLKDFQTLIISVISLYYNTDDNFEKALYILKDVNEEDINIKKVEEFRKKNHYLVNVDSFIENIEKIIKSKEIEKDVQKEIQSCSGKKYEKDIGF